MAQNPFCASRLRPEAMPFLFSQGHAIEQLIEQLERTEWQGQIVGPHGSGKSTLLAMLVPAIERAGKTVLATALHDGQRRLPREFRVAMGHDCPTVLVVDGYEQLGFWSRFSLRRFCRNRGRGLIITSHQPAGLPDLFRTSIDLELAWRVVEQLQRGFPAQIAYAELAERFAQRQGDLRETLFDLYDVYESRRPRPSGEPAVPPKKGL